MADTSHHIDQQQLHHRGQEQVHSFKNYLHEKTPQILTIITLFPIGAFLLFVVGLALTALFGSLVGLAITAPLFVIFSPVIVPAVLVIGLAVTGFLTSGACGITGLSAISWIVNFLRGSRMGKSVEHVMGNAHETAGHMGQKVKDMGRNVAGRAHEAGTA